MRTVKLSLIAALAAGSFSTLSAKSLEEAIKNVDLSGFAWYRYDTGRFTKKTLDGGGYDLNAAGVPYPGTHRYRVELGVKADIGDGFSIFGQLLHSSNNHSFAEGNWPQGAVTNRTFNLKQAYLEYANADYGLNFKLGRQNLNTVWTDDLAGMAAKASYSVDGLTVALFAVDSFEDDGANNAAGDDEANFTYLIGNRLATNNAETLSQDTARSWNARLYKYNMYGGAVLGDFEGLKAELWGAYWQKTANLWALKLDYNLQFSEDASWRLHANYYGNTVNKELKELVNLDNGQLVNLKGEIKAHGFDASLGGIMFGKKQKYTINTIEEPTGNDGDLFIGTEIFYQRGSWAVLSQGQNRYGYFDLGYTLPSDIRIGLRGVYGGTKIGSGSATFDARNGGGKKMEGVARISWKYNDSLSFLTYYSYLNTKAKNGLGASKDATSTKNAIRFQARYDF